MLRLAASQRPLAATAAHTIHASGLGLTPLFVLRPLICHLIKFSKHFMREINKVDPRYVVNLPKYSLFKNLLPTLLYNSQASDGTE